MSQKENISIKIKDIFKSFRIWLLIIFIFVSYVAVFNFNLPFSNDGVVITGIKIGSAAEKAGMEFNTNSQLLAFEKILYINNEKITTIEDFTNYLSEQELDSKITIKTDKNPVGYEIELKNQNNKTAYEILGISVDDAYKSNIRLGIELVGGSRLLLKPTNNITNQDFDLLVSTMQNRLNIYGASGTKVSKIESNLLNERFVLIESLSSNKNEVFDLISRQGEFEAKVGNISVFTGDNILKVFTDPQHAGLQSCSDVTDGIICTYAFSVEIDSDGADNFFKETSKLSVVGTHLSEKVYFYLDGTEITGLNIASSFKYSKVTTPQISVSGKTMPTKEKAIESAQKEMKLLQTILSTKSLPSELKVEQSYSISSSLGQKLLDNALIVGFASLLLVSGIVALRYRYFGIFIGIFIALVSELIIVFGFAAFMRFSIDLAAIGGLIAAIGTGVDDQIIITDEYFRKKNQYISSRKKVKNAFYIIMIAYLTTLAAMSPFLFSPSLSLIKGFAFMIIVGVTVGVFITRPAYAVILRILMTTREQRKEEADQDD